jgi:hypothetical protein
LQPCFDTPERQREICSCTLDVADHLAGCACKLRRLEVVRPERRRALQHRRRKPGLEMGKAGAPEQVMNLV